MPGTLKVGGNIIASHTGVEGAGTVTLQNIFASTSDVQGNHKEGTITTGTNSLTVNNSTDILNGDYVVGEGIAPGTTVSSGEGTTTLTLSANVNASLSAAPVSFYHNNKALSAGTVAGGLCRAWVKFDSSGVISSSYNVSSVTDESGTYHQADYTVNFTTAMPDADYIITGAGQSPATQAYYMSVFGVDPTVDPTASNCRVTFRTVVNQGASAAEINLDTEPDFGYVAFFR